MCSGNKDKFVIMLKGPKLSKKHLNKSACETRAVVSITKTIISYS